MRPRLIPRPIVICPQWPRVVTATMLQLPSNWAASAGGAEQMIAKAVARAKARIRVPTMEVLIRVLYRLSIRAPGREARLFNNEHKTANFESIDRLEA